MTIPDAFNLALQRHRAGNAAEAESIYRQILAQQPDHAETLHLLGVLLSQTGRHDAALGLVSRAVHLHPANPDFHCNLGLVLYHLGRLADAAMEYEKAIDLNPVSVDACYNLGNVLRDLDKTTDSIAAYDKALSLRPDHEAAINNLASLLRSAGRLEESVALYERALKIRPDFADAWGNLANLLKEIGPARLPHEIACRQRVVALRPQEPQAYKQLGTAAQRARIWPQAADAFAAALERNPNDPGLYRDLSAAWRLKPKPNPQAAPESLLPLPYLGDKVVLLHCDRATREQLRAAGLHGGYAINASDGVDLWLAAQLARSESQKLPETIGKWIDWVRNEAAMSGTTCAFWLPEIPPAVADAVRQAAPENLIEISGPSAAEIHARLSAHAVTPPNTQDKIFAVMAIRNGGVELLPHWLQHYTRLGVDEIIIGVFDDLAAETSRQIDEFASRWKFRRFRQSWSPASETEQYAQRETGCRLAGAGPLTWIMHTDLDELHEYPAPIRQITQAAAEKQIEAVYGRFVDRVAPSGSLAPIRPDPSLWEQFPMECKLTERILRGATQKVMLTRYRVQVTVGHHAALDHPHQAPAIGTAEDYRVAHFKWHAAVLGRLRWLQAEQNLRLHWQSEEGRFLGWLNRHGGRIDLSDPALESHPAAARA